MARAGTQANITTAAVEIYNSTTDGAATSIRIIPSGSALVQVAGLHGSDEWMPVGTDGETFRVGYDGLSTVQIKSASSATISADFGVVASGVRKNWAR